MERTSFRGSVATAALLVTLFFVPVQVHAQVDSFFDIFVDVGTEAPDTQCDPCVIIEQEIEEKRSAIGDIEKAIEDIEQEVTFTEGAIESMQEELADTEKQLAEMQDPQDYVESEGRRYDSSDHAAMRRRSASLWEAYKSGDLSAEEYQEEISKEFDDPDVQKELERLKEEIEEELEDAIEDLEEELEDAEEHLEDLNEMAEELIDQLEDCLDELERLLEALEDCLNRCSEEDVNVPEDYEFEQKGLGERITDFFKGLFGGEEQPPIGDTDTIVERLGQGELDLPPAGEIPIELVELELQSVDLVPFVADSFFDVFVELEPEDVKPECKLCDPLAKEIVQKEADLARAKATLAVLQKQKLDIDRAVASGERALEGMKNDVDAFNNPQNFVESDGRRYDSSDHAAHQRRNAELWEAYKNGRMSAGELESEWRKDFWDPDVQKDIERIKKELRKEAEEEIQSMEENIADLKKHSGELDREIAALEAEIRECEDKFAEMKRQYEECKKQCKARDEAVKFIEELLGDPELWEPPVGGFTLPEYDEEGDGCMTRRVCEETCVPEGKACVEVSKEGKTCFVCSDQNDCEAPAMNLKECEAQCDGGSCSRDFRAGPACFVCTGCLKPSMTRRACEESCVIEGGGCVKNDAAGVSCYDCDMENACDPPAMNLKECEEKCWGCTRNYKAGLACFNCDKPREDAVSSEPAEEPEGDEDEDEDEDEDDDDDAVAGQGFICGLPLIGDIVCGDPESDDYDDPVMGEIEQCPHDMFLDQFACRGTCHEDCEVFDRLSDGRPCWRCHDDNMRVDYIPCEKPTMEKYRCDLDCDKSIGCDIVYTRANGEHCYECAEDDPHELGDGEQILGEDGGEYDYGGEEDPRDPEDSEDSEEEVCDAGTSEIEVCTRSCDGECVRSYKRGDGVDCFVCVQPPEPIADPEEPEVVEVCDSGTVELSECSRNCDGECIESYTRRDDVSCYVCAQPPEPEEEEECDTGTEELSDCSRRCDGECVRSYERDDGVDCYVCVQPPEPLECDSPTMDEGECRASCDGTCSKVYTRDDGVKCFECLESQPPEPEEECDSPTVEEHVCRSDCDGSCHEVYRRDDGVGCYECVVDEEPRCPSGMAPTESGCLSACPSDGVCLEDSSGCYQCVVVSCPDGYERQRPDCPNGVETITDRNTGVECHKCKQDCATVCAERGYYPESHDHSDAILGELQQEVCVSGASISIQTATINDCRCIGDYSISIDRTPPVCDPTPCGPVDCNSSLSCPTGENTTTTVTCNWNGWEKIQKHQFRPVFGN